MICLRDARVKEGYRPLASVNRVEKENRSYSDRDVRKGSYTEFLEADSKGQYFNEFIKDLYAYQEAE